MIGGDRTAFGFFTAAAVLLLGAAGAAVLVMPGCRQTTPAEARPTAQVVEESTRPQLPPAELETDRSKPFRYPEGAWGQGRLRYLNGVPVLEVRGTPEEMGAQIGHLALKPARRVMDFPREALNAFDAEWSMPLLKWCAGVLAQRFPEHHRREMNAMAAAADVPIGDMLVGNTAFDIYKGLGCSLLAVEPQRSAGNRVLLGRNLDFPTLGWLHEYSLVTVYHPLDGHAFATIGFPGYVGCLSGMNDAGLSIAVAESYDSADNAPSVNYQGIPYGLANRLLLERCATVPEAQNELAQTARTVMIGLMVCDARQALALEITATSLVARSPLKGLLAMTNHFRSPGLATLTECPRYDAMTCDTPPALDLDEMASRLHAANQGSLTLQTMVFVPAARELHLSLGAPPTTRGPLRRLDLTPLFAGE